jgi:DNA-binding PadR family transcriptional regulator
MPRQALGEIEHLTLLAILHLGEGAYGAAIIEATEKRTGRELSQAAAYIALKRLEEKDLVRSHRARGAPARGGRPRRVYALTKAGLLRLRESGHALFAMWSGLEQHLEPR